MIILRLNLKPRLLTFGVRKLLSHQRPTSNPIWCNVSHKTFTQGPFGVASFRDKKILKFTTAVNLNPKED